MRKVRYLHFSERKVFGVWKAHLVIGIWAYESMIWLESQFLGYALATSRLRLVHRISNSIEAVSGGMAEQNIPNSV